MKPTSFSLCVFYHIIRAITALRPRGAVNAPLGGYCHCSYPLRFYVVLQSINNALQHEILFQFTSLCSHSIIQGCFSTSHHYSLVKKRSMCLLSLSMWSILLILVALETDRNCDLIAASAPRSNCLPNLLEEPTNLIILERSIPKTLNLYFNWQFPKSHI